MKEKKGKEPLYSHVKRFLLFKKWVNIYCFKKKTVFVVLVFSLLHSFGVWPLSWKVIGVVLWYLACHFSDFLSRFFSMWFDYDLSWYGFLPVYAVQDFAELFELVIVCLWQMLGSLRPLFRFFFFPPVERLEEGDFDFSLTFLHYMNYLSQ